MKLLAYKDFVNLNYILAVGVITMPWLISNSFDANIAVSIFGLAILGTLFLAKKIQQKIVIYTVFLLAICATFSQYFFDFSSNQSLVAISMALPCLTLLSLTFTQLIEK